MTENPPILYAAEISRGCEPRTVNPERGEVERVLYNHNSPKHIEPYVSVSVLRAWMIDRAEQYDDGTGCREAIHELLKGLDAGDPWEAARHGELDDLLKRSRRQDAKRGGEGG